jgi:hypothetical protein
MFCSRKASQLDEAKLPPSNGGIPHLLARTESDVLRLALVYFRESFDSSAVGPAVKAAIHGV